MNDLIKSLAVLILAEMATAAATEIFNGTAEIKRAGGCPWGQRSRILDMMNKVAQKSYDEGRIEDLGISLDKWKETIALAGESLVAPY